MKISKELAKVFMLRKHHLIGDYFTSITEIIDHLTCIQFDPVDVCGRSPDILLHSRLHNYRLQDLQKELYEKRTLIEYYDKNLCIFAWKEWPHFDHIRRHFNTWIDRNKEVIKLNEATLEALKTRGPLCSKDFENQGKTDWFWGPAKAAKASLESLYYRGKIIVHHRERNLRYFALASAFGLEETQEMNVHEALKYYVFRRIKAVGLLWDKASDAYLGLSLKAAERALIVHELLEEKKLIEIEVEGVNVRCLMAAEDAPILEEVMAVKSYKSRLEFIAPLDNMIWDRKWIKELFGFSYTWEIYTPVEKRIFGYYTLPILYGTTFIGRIEMARDATRKLLIVKKIWYEDESYKSRLPLIQKALKRYQKFSSLEGIEYDKEILIC